MSTTIEHRRTWWRRNRWGLVALPVVLVLALAAGSSRVHDYWWVRGFHQPAPVTSGVASLVDEYDDGRLSYPIEARYSIASFGPADEVTLRRGEPLPAGVRAWRLELAVEADPDMVLSGCQLAVVDAEGNRHTADDSGLDLETPSSPCVPSDTRGPQPMPGSTAAPVLPTGEAPRPERYTTETVFVLPEEAVPATVRVWHLLPRYVELPVEASGA